MSIWRVRANSASRRAIRPKPTRPSVLALSSRVLYPNFCTSPGSEPVTENFPSLSAFSARLKFLAQCMMAHRACSATALVLAPGVFTTWIPSRVAAATSMLSIPIPWRPMTFRFLPAIMTALLSGVLRMRRASALPIRGRRSASEGEGAMVTAAELSKMPIPIGEIGSVRRT